MSCVPGTGRLYSGGGGGVKFYQFGVQYVRTRLPPAMDACEPTRLIGVMQASAGDVTSGMQHTRPGCTLYADAW